jgi:hypothetical protein
MNIDLKDIPVKLLIALGHLKKYSLFICILVVLGIYLFLVWQIRYLATLEPTSSDVINKVNELNTPKLDQDAIDKMLQLEEQNIEVRALFEKARQNPFQE